MVQRNGATEADLGEALLLASRALVGVAARSLAGLGDVTVPQFRALVLVSSRERTTVSDLAHALDIHPTTATRLCDRLVARKLVRRVQGPSDRRETEVHLAAAGRRIVAQVTEQRRRDLTDIAARMGPEAAGAALAGLLAFAEAAGEHGDRDDLFGWGDGASTLGGSADA